MNKIFTRGLLTSFIIVTIFSLNLLIPQAPLQAQSMSLCQTIEALIVAGVIAPDKANAARASGGCPVPVKSQLMATVASSSLALTYDSQHKESQLTATILFNLNGGSNGINLYGGIGGAYLSFANDNGSVQADSFRLGAPTPVSPNVTTIRNTYNDTNFFVIPAGKSVLFQATSTIKTSELFAGAYHATLYNVTVEPDNNTDHGYSLVASPNQTNSVTIIGETSPYITRVTSVKTSSGDVALGLQGSRLSSGDVLYIDNVKTNLTGSVINPGGLTYVLIVGSMSAGNHSLYLVDPVTGQSNTVPFTVSGTINTQPTVTVASSTMALTYDSNNKESQLTAVFNASVTAGNADIYLYTNTASVNLFDQKNNQVSANSLNVKVNVATGEKTDPYGRDYTIVPTGKTVQLSVILTASPKELFAGSYYAKLNYLYMMVGSDYQNIADLVAPVNQTNSVAIIGEVSPYITSASYGNYGQSGTNLVVSGLRLRSSAFIIDGVYMDSSNIGIDGGDTKLGIFTSLSNGNHTVQLSNPNSGLSNVAFVVSGATTTISTSTTTFICSQFTYSPWSVCSKNSQSRTVTSSSPAGCINGSPMLTQSCTVTPPPPTTATVTIGQTPNLACTVNRITLAWAPVTGEPNYNVRVDDTTSNGWSGKCSAADPANTGDLCWNGYAGTSLPNFAVKAGDSYTFWVDAPKAGTSTRMTFAVPTCSASKSNNWFASVLFGWMK